MKTLKTLALLLVALTAAPTAFAEQITGEFSGTMSQGNVDLPPLDGINGRHGNLRDDLWSRFPYIDAYIDSAIVHPEDCPYPIQITPSGTAVFMTLRNTGAVFVEIDEGQALCPVFTESFTGTITGGTGVHEGATGTATFTLVDDRVLYATLEGAPTFMFTPKGSYTLNIY